MLALVVFEAGLFALVMLRRPTAAASVETVRPRAETSKESAVLIATGYVVAHHKIQVGSKITGRVAWIGVADDGMNAITVISGAHGRLTPTDVLTVEPLLAAADAVLTGSELVRANIQIFINLTRIGGNNFTAKKFGDVQAEGGFSGCSWP